MPIRVLLADDHNVVRQGLRMFLTLDPELDVIGEAENGAEAVRLAETLKPDVVVMDLVMPVMSGLEATSAIRSKHMPTQVLALTSVVEDTAVTAVIRAGAIGYLVKDTGADELRQAIKAAARGEPQLSPQIAARLLIETSGADSPEVLTERDSELLHLTAQGLTDQEIANRLTVAQPAVRTHLTDILDKIRLAQESQAALLEFSSKLLNRSDPAALMNDLVHETQRLMASDACALLLPDAEPGYLVVRAASGWRRDPVAARHRVPLADDGGPGWVMREGRPCQVEDLAQAESDGDGPLSDYAGWDGEGFRGHALIPLLVDGRAIGVLALDSRQPRLLDPDELRFVRLLANQAALILEQSRLLEAEHNQHGLEQDLAVAREIQLGLLPERCPVVPGWEFATAYQAARHVGGDLYDFIELPGTPRRIGLLIADVSGKGAAAALFMAYSRAVIRAAAQRNASPLAAVRQANELLAKDNQANLFVSAYYAVLDTTTGQVTAVNAGHNPPLVLRAGRERRLEELPTAGLVLGVSPTAKYQEEHYSLAPGDVLVLYTDGITEAANGANDLFDLARLKHELRAAPDHDPQAMLDSVLAAVRAFSGGAAQADDFTLIVVKRWEDDTDTDTIANPALEAT